MFLLLCRHLSGSQRIHIALAWVQKLSPSADTRRCFVIPSGTTSPVLPLLHSLLIFLALDICCLLCKHGSFFTSSTRREDHQNPSLQHCFCLGTLVPDSFNNAEKVPILSFTSAFIWFTSNLPSTQHSRACSIQEYETSCSKLSDPPCKACGMMTKHQSNLWEASKLHLSRRTSCTTSSNEPQQTEVHSSFYISGAWAQLATGSDTPRRWRDIKGSSPHGSCKGL